MAETVLHGNPSGVDNTVAVFGGGLAFTRAGFGERKGVEIIPALVFVYLVLARANEEILICECLVGTGSRVFGSY